MTEIVPLSQEILPEVKKFTDQQIGENYYDIKELTLKWQASKKQGLISSFVLIDSGEVQGLRLSFPPGQWIQGKGEKLSPHLWPHPIEETAYFQSLFIAPHFQRKGWGTRLSLKSIEVLRKLEAHGVVCHSWVESPGQSSQKYLMALQFKSICLYPEFWKEVDYVCSRDGQPCLCTAEEMYLDLTKGAR